jgi:hypothetical protein
MILKRTIIYLKMICFFILLTVMACKKEGSVNEPTEGFESIPLAKALPPLLIDEASGIADSKVNTGYLWVQQDSGNPNDIALLSHDGVLLKKINIKPASNRDWEDMAIGNGPLTGTNYIYLADIGDNAKTASQYFIYRFAEPASATDTVFNCDKLVFQYPDGSHDAEAIFVDNSTKDIYIITKQDNPSKIYKLAYPQNTGGVNTAIQVGSLTFSGATASAISADGKEILIKSYTSVYYWKRNTTHSIEQVLSTTPFTLAYQFEPQGEAVCFKNDNSGFFTLSERPAIVAAVNLNYYKRK